MRKTLLLGAAIVLQLTAGRAQCPFPDINYSGYYEVFSDDFNYNPATFKSDPAFTAKWLIPMPSSCAGNATSVIDPANITMPASGRIRFTERNAPGICPGKDHTSGWLHTQLPYVVDFGIIEASIKFPPYQGYDSISAFPTFWIPNYHADPTWSWMQLDDSSRRNEIDIMDNHDGHTWSTWPKFYTYVPQYHDTVLQAADEISLNSSINHCFPTTIDLSNKFHRFSCLWTPSRIIFYVDRHYVRHYDFDGNRGATQVARTVRQIHSLIVALQTHEHTVPNLSMEVEWVRYLAQQCNAGDFIVDPGHAYNLTNPPYLPPDYATNYASDFNKLRYRQVIINQASTVQAKNTLATMIEAEATTILPNFLADESHPIWGASTANKQDKNQQWISVPIPMNGYLEIRPVACEWHPDAGEGWPDNGVNGFGGEGPVYDQRPGSNAAIRLFPNPSDGDFTVVFPDSAPYSIRVINMIGETMYHMETDHVSSWQASLGGQLPAGQYLVEVTGPAQQSIHKLTILK